MSAESGSPEILLCFSRHTGFAAGMTRHIRLISYQGLVTPAAAPDQETLAPCYVTSYDRVLE